MTNFNWLLDGSIVGLYLLVTMVAGLMVRKYVGNVEDFLVAGREMDVFRLITKGLSNAEIGQELFISDTTVKTHVTRLLQKLDLRDRAQAIVLAYQTGLFDASEK